MGQRSKQRMPDENRKSGHYRLLAVCVVLLLAMLWDWLGLGQPGSMIHLTTPAPTSRGTDEHTVNPTTRTTMLAVIYLVGAVQRPGIYRTAEGTCLQEVVALAGGLREDAEPERINLAQGVRGGQMYRIPARGDSAVDDWVPAPVVVNPSPAPRININTAQAEDFDRLPGIGPATAQAVIEYRNRHGPFQKIEDLMRIPGIKQNRFDQIKDRITV